MWFTKKRRKGEESTIVNHLTIGVTCIFSMAKVMQSHAKLNAVNQENTKGRASAFYVLLPLQSTIGDMHTSRTTSIGLHKRFSMHTCMYRSFLRDNVFNNEQAGCQPTQTKPHLQVYVIKSSEAICSRTCRNMHRRNTLTKIPVSYATVCASKNSIWQRYIQVRQSTVQCGTTACNCNPTPQFAPFFEFTLVS